MVHRLNSELSNLSATMPTYKSFIGRVVIPCSQHLILNTGAPTHPVDELHSQDFLGTGMGRKLNIFQALPDILNMPRAENW